MIKEQHSLIKEVGDLQSRKKDFRNTNLNKLIISRLKKGTVLDIGTGSGYLVYFARKNNIRAIGLEPDNNLIAISKKYYGDLGIKNKSAEEINTLKQKFDNITIIDVLEHVEDDNLIVKKIYDQLRRGGRLIINVPAIKFLYVERAKQMGDLRRYSKIELINVLKKNKFKIREIRYWNFIGFWSTLVIEKILNKRLQSNVGGLRSDNPKGIKRYANGLLNFWFSRIENKFDFGLGLSLFCVAEKKLA